MFIQTEATPNPATLKFLPGQEVVGTGSVVDFSDSSTAQRSPLAAKLFEIDGVTGVFLGSDFISVTKNDEEWAHLKPVVLGAIMEHFMSGAPVLAAAEGESDGAAPGHSSHTDYAGADVEIVDQIKEILDTRVRPAVAQDGGDITFDRYESGTVFLHMRGACAGCPSATITLQSGIENLLKHYIPEIDRVEQAL